MDYSMDSRVRRPCTLNHPIKCHHRHTHHHHHHHFQALPQCPLHSYMLYSNNHSPNCSLFTSHPQNDVTSHQHPNIQSLPLPQPVQTAPEVRLMIEEWEEEEEEDPVFVLTDEWREFFAKSEAKRRQAKKQAKRRNEKTDG